MNSFVVQTGIKPIGEVPVKDRDFITKIDEDFPFWVFFLEQNYGVAPFILAVVLNVNFTIASEIVVAIFWTRNSLI